MSTKYDYVDKQQTEILVTFINNNILCNLKRIIIFIFSLKIINI